MLIYHTKRLRIAISTCSKFHAVCVFSVSVNEFCEYSNLFCCFFRCWRWFAHLRLISVFLLGSIFHTHTYNLCRLVHIALVLVHALCTQALTTTYQWVRSLSLSLSLAMCVFAHWIMRFSIRFLLNLCVNLLERAYTNTHTVRFYYKWSQWFSNFYANRISFSMFYLFPICSIPHAHSIFFCLSASFLAEPLFYFDFYLFMFFVCILFTNLHTEKPHAKGTEKHRFFSYQTVCCFFQFQNSKLWIGIY